jgi:hypothetical protein
MGESVGLSYLTDVSDEEWEFVLPYLLLSCADQPESAARSAGVVQRGAVHREDRQPVALDAARPASLASAGVGRTGRIRWGQAAQGIQGAHRGRYAGPPDGAAGDTGDREQVSALAEQIQ